MNERKTMLIYAEPTRDEIIKWANTALRNSDIGFIDESLIEDFKDGLSAFVATDQLAPAQTWQPIETAPKDGTPVLLLAGARDWHNNEVPSIGWWLHTYGWVGHFASGSIPTHWMPLPAAPAPEVAE